MVVRMRVRLSVLSRGHPSGDAIFFGSKDIEKKQRMPEVIISHDVFGLQTSMLDITCCDVCQPNLQLEVRDFSLADAGCACMFWECSLKKIRHEDPGAFISV